MAKDHTSLRQQPPPYYLFPENDETTSTADDLTQLLILVTGADGTPYSRGLWKLHLKIPSDYPISPPKATFKTRIFHPNVDEQTGSVCLETLKRDWDPKLTLKDILVTISCLLIQPNPDSALNSAAGALIQEDFEAFSKQAKLMTSIHAPVPKHLLHSVREAQMRGECLIDQHVTPKEMVESVRLKQQPLKQKMQPCETHSDMAKSQDKCSVKRSTSASTPHLSSTKSVLGKHLLAEPSSSINTDASGPPNITFATPSLHGLDASTAATVSSHDGEPQQPVRKSPKLRHLAAGHVVTEVSCMRPHDLSFVQNEEEKENSVGASHIQKFEKTPHLPSAQPASRPSLRKVSNIGSGREKALPRVGIRRL